MKYRSEIDGLRAFAVLPVVFYHAGFKSFGGGFVGVDIFFVISGYLITSIILNELNTNSFSLKKFYERRARRILPALISVILFTSFLSFIFLTRNELSSYFKSVISSILFFSNFYFYKTVPYFKSEADLEPLIHTWSLSIEEQFYIVFPITMLFFFKFLKKYIFLFLISSFLISLFVCQFLAFKNLNILNFYFSLSRAWELSLGGICAYLTIYKNFKFSKFSKNFFSTLGIFVILFSIFFFKDKTNYPSVYALIPTFATSLVILFTDEDTFIKKILSLKLLVGFGLISYSLYLWHQPLLVFGKIFFENLLLIHKIGLIVISIFLSCLSYLFIEKIFRDKLKMKFQKFSIIVLTISISLIIFSIISFKFFSSKNSTEAHLAKLLTKTNAVYATKMDERKFIKNRIIHENLDPKILIIGSSRIMQISNENFDEQVINLGVSGASIEDHISITMMALEKFNIERIILGADPWLFNKNNNQLRWKSISKEYNLAKKIILSQSEKRNIIHRFEENKNYHFYESFLEKIYNKLNNRNLSFDLFLKNKNIITKNYIQRDGKRIYGKKRNKEELQVRKINYSMDKYEFSNENYTLYKDFIKYLKNIRKKEVIILMSPYHFPSYELTIKTKPYYYELESKIKELSKSTNIKFLGSFDASNVSCFENEFRDYMHPDDKCMIKITNKLLEN